MRRFPMLVLPVLLIAGAFAVEASRAPDASALAEAKQEAEQANARYQALAERARRATNAADRARAEGAALAARIEAAEADLTAAQRRIALIERLQAAQRARVAERQQPLARLTAALETMARRPAALALVQPGSMADAAHVRSLLAATLPEIRRRTAALRAEVERSDILRRQAETASAALLASREQLRRRRDELAQFEAAQRTQSAELSGLATAESDRALALGEQARALDRLVGTRQYQAQLAARLSDLPGPLPRPGGASGEPAAHIPYTLPVEGRLLTGVGEISDGGVHSRGLTIEVGDGARVVAPANGRILFAAPFRSYGNVVIIDHGSGWTSVVTDLAELRVARGQAVRRGAPIGRVGANRPQVTVELLRAGRPVPFAQLIAG